tara:strand:+ start:1410 stop:1571 length:162 start_codon:yes stop_codon:yes gene_type:complete
MGSGMPFSTLKTAKEADPVLGVRVNFAAAHRLAVFMSGERERVLDRELPGCSE